MNTKNNGDDNTRIVVEHYQFMNSIPQTRVGTEKVVVQNSRTAQNMERNSLIRADIEKVIMDLMNLQDDLIEKYCSVEAPARQTTRDVWEMHRRFTLITSSLRRLKANFIPAVADHPNTI